MSGAQAQLDRVQTSVQGGRDPNSMQMVSHRHRKNGKRLMNHHNDSFINIPLATVLMSMPWWIGIIEEYSWIVGKLFLPTLGLILVILQILYVIKKIKGGKRPE
jgi:hypothetical protein